MHLFFDRLVFCNPKSEAGHLYMCTTTSRAVNESRPEVLLLTNNLWMSFPGEWVKSSESEQIHNRFI